MNNYLLFDMDGTLWSTVELTQEASKIISEKYDYFNITAITNNQYGPNKHIHLSGK